MIDLLSRVLRWRPVSESRHLQVNATEFVSEDYMMAKLNAALRENEHSIASIEQQLAEVEE